jgi:DNA-binding CsgD family transcriptional regulator
MLLLLGRQQWKSGQPVLANERIGEAIALLEALPPGRDLAMAYSARSQLAMTDKRADEAVEFGQRALDLAIQFGDYGVQSHALNNMGAAIYCAPGERARERGLEKMEQSLAIAREHDLQAHAGRAYSNLVSGLVRSRSPLAERYLTNGLAYCELHDVQEQLIYLRSWTAYFELGSGRWDTAARIATEVLQHTDPSAIPERVTALLVLTTVRVRRGDPGAGPLLDEALKLALSTGELQRIAPVAALRAELAWYCGDLERVAAEAAVGLTAAATHWDEWLEGEVAFWAHRADSSKPVRADLAAPYRLMSQGDWESAAAAWHELKMPYESALALADGTEEAQREALAILEELGAGPLAAIVRHRLREQGVRGIPRGPRASTRNNPAGLTSREVEVLRLLVHGHTNPDLAEHLHLSVKTVDHHVSAILEKLDVHSRTEAVAAAFGLGIVKPVEDPIART